MSKSDQTDKRLYKQEGYDLVGAAFEVYNELGQGFIEGVYQDALEVELELNELAFTAQPDLQVNYKGRDLKTRYRPDLFVEEGIVVELKAVSGLCDDHVAQLMNYLKATGKPVGYLINFGNADKLEWKRIANTEGNR